MFSKFVLYPSCVNVVLPTGVNVVSATVLIQLQQFHIYADDRCTQQKTFEQVDIALAGGLNELGIDYKEHNLRPNPANTQLTAFHHKNRQADRKLYVTWNGTKLEHTHSHVYLGITLDRSLTYRNHCMKTRAKPSCRNILPRKLHGWTVARAHSPPPRGRRRHHYVSSWPSIVVQYGLVPRIER